ncbi:DNA methylase [Janthinobacterium agaricidamnosum]|uniref:DNA methylase n=1 Tax=Janthinobacterium agaricidamnosum TaxID=55508 RepID=A0A3G2EIC4_9BURK|nr:DNA methyltransferase [Janthinobacterium agaricidamnosum]AYM78765.1 DNA methylase [Janthinobacterium agaricidamnosum]
MQLNWHPYKYYPYERDFAKREIESLLSPASLNENAKGIILDNPNKPELANRLVYFSSIESETKIKHTEQSLLERSSGVETKRQATRYSAHGLHEYKGKFNPQVAKALLNIFRAEPGQIAFDPFCGSGTSLVECAHLGIKSVGTDINPLAVFLANAKLRALGVPAEQLRREALDALFRAKKLCPNIEPENERTEYLRSWFSVEQLLAIESLRLSIETTARLSSPILLAIGSNLLRDYSQQEPSDLRIRRRISELPILSFFDAFENAVEVMYARLKESQKTLGLINSDSVAINVDCKIPSGNEILLPQTFDLALTSPPYATALPYIDTQRLSLIWLGLIPPSEILPLESRLVGSREIRGESKSSLLKSLEENAANLPDQELQYCITLQNALSDSDGFRRQVVPRLLYRYFAGMSVAFSAVRKLMKPNAPFGLIVGGNHTTLNGTRFDINTPGHLASIAASCGWNHIETVPLQTYRRYGLHVNNATTTEALVILRA